MKYLITGGTGFIGRELCQALLTRNHSLVVLSRSPEKVVTTLGKQVTPLNHLQDLASSEYFDGIINLAGAPIFGGRWTDKRKRVICNSRIQITQDLVEFIARSHKKPGVFLSGSAVGFYGDHGDHFVSETSPGYDEFGHRLCVDWEREAEKASDQSVRVCLLRTGLVVGKNGGFLKPMILPFKLGLGGRLGSGQQWMPWIHLHDHISIILHLLEKPTLEGIFNLTSPNPVTNREFTRTLAGILHRPAFLHIPAWALNLILGEMSELLLGGQRAIPTRIQDAGFSFKYPTLDVALQNVLAD